MTVAFTNRQRRFDRRFLSDTETIVREVADACYRCVPFGARPGVAGRFVSSIHVEFIGPRLMKRINAEKRGVDVLTDVLSFPMMEMREGRLLGRVSAEDLQPSESGGLPILFFGDVLLSLDRAVEQASGFGHSVDREIAFLTAHAVLHLFGYDHGTPEEERRMRRNQREVLDPLGYRRTT